MRRNLSAHCAPFALWLALGCASLGCGSGTSDGAGDAANGGTVSAGGTSGSAGAGGGTGGTGSAAGSSNGGGGQGGSANTGCAGTAGSGVDAAAGSPAEDAACGLILYPVHTYEPTCQAWLETNCCGSLEACAASTVCRSLVDCISDCGPPPMPACCFDACVSGLTSTPPELDDIAQCTKTLPGLPDDCDWPP